MADAISDTSGLPTAKAPVQFKATTITTHQQQAAIASNALELEDDFESLYRGQPTGLNLIKPPYNFYQLEKLTQENNALQPCIEAMETNIDGTGYTIERRDGEPAEKEDPEYKLLDDFFKEIYPGMSFVTARCRVRRDMEGTGNAYMEVMRALDDSIVFARPIESKMVRLVELDAAVPGQKTLNRAGREATFTTSARERRFAMKASGDSRIVYFKEFGASRDLNKNTGLSAKPGERLPADQRATELINFTCKRDIRTPYGVPRWVTQTPSVMGSRHAEEHNLDFYDSGGIPPLLVFVQGGELVSEAKETLNQILNGKTKNKHRAAVMEAFSTSGSFDSAGNVRVTVERFGAERMSDSMFEKYDDKCELRIRRAFRLPPIFVGAASDYGFATAFASYTVAEAQVFAPERDEVIDTTLRVGLGVKNHRVRSKPLAVRDVSQQIQALTLTSEKSAVGGEQLVEQLNQVTNLLTKFDEEVYQQA